MTKIVLIGAGSAQFGYGTLGEVLASKVLQDCELVLHDINAEALDRVYQAGKAFIEKEKLACRLSATVDRKVALEGAEFVVISIEVGDRFALWDQDRTVPQQYGIRQVFGENGGPGGLFHALRIIPPILAICEDVRAICDQATVFNYSNPMSRICTTVHRAFPDLRFVGLCHEIASLERYLPPMLKVPFEELELRAAGLNHFSCLLEARYKSNGQDAYPDIRARAHEFFSAVPGSSDHLQHYLATGKTFDTEGSHTMSPELSRAARDWTERGLFKFVLEQLDLLPITTDSHFGEYLGWAYEVVDHKGIMDFYRYYRSCLCTAEPRIERTIKERLIPIIAGILTDQGFEEPAVNLPNQSYLRELPSSIAVEVPGIISKSGVRGVSLAALPRAYAALLQNQVGIHEMTAEAVLTRSRRAAAQALLVDPVVDRAVCARELVDVMISLQPQFLGYLS
ncbi:alpha-glucosidase [bacterium CPR1]|nr:alpha-glucosidase [bacterium CPR1]